MFITPPAKGEPWGGFHELFEAEASKLLAQALGHYDWLAYDYVASGFHTSPGDFPGVVEVA
jgi:hypothetical protein